MLQWDTTSTYQATATATTLGISSLVAQRGSGIGVTYLLDTSSQIDGFGPDDALKVDLGGAFDIYDFTFASVQANDTIVISIDSNGVYSGNPYPSNGVSITSTVGQNIEFTVAGWNDDYYLSSISANVPDSGTSVTLLGLGLLGLVGFRRRFSK